MQTESGDAMKPSILVADDTPANLQLLSDMLKGRGYTIRAALNGRLAMQSMRNDPPDLVLLDVNMPDISGYEVCRRMKADETLCDIPVIFVSAMDESTNKMAGFSVGGVDYITKPFQIEEVAARIRIHLELRRQRRELQESNLHLRELEELRDNLVHMIIHDMRNCLWNTHAHLECLRDPRRNADPQDIQRHTDEAIAATQDLMGMVNSILDVSKMEAGLIPLSLSECDMAEIVQRAIAKVAALKGARTLCLEPPTEGVQVFADADLVGRVVDNLLANALRYTREDAGEIRFRLERFPQSVRVQIEDNGQGIPEVHQQRIFEKFYQVKSALSGNRHSTGLGLTFCKLVVEAHGGKIGVVSEENRGSLFWFELPVNGPATG